MFWYNFKHETRKKYKIPYTEDYHHVMNHGCDGNDIFWKDVGWFEIAEWSI